MRKFLKYLVLAACVMTVSCNDDDDAFCGLENPERFIAQIETVSETYAVDEPLFINGEVSSMVFNSCDGGNFELITNNLVFRDALFVLKLKEDVDGFNADVVDDVEVTYFTGEELDSTCNGAIEFAPELSGDNNTYNYRLSLAVSEPGDYVIINGFNLVFTDEANNNAQIFDTYNTLDNFITFEACDNIFTREGTDDFYFFTIQ